MEFQKGFSNLKSRVKQSEFLILWKIDSGRRPTNDRQSSIWEVRSSHDWLYENWRTIYIICIEDFLQHSWRISHISSSLIPVLHTYLPTYIINTYVNSVVYLNCQLQGRVPGRHHLPGLGHVRPRRPVHQPDFLRHETGD